MARTARPASEQITEILQAGFGFSPDDGEAHFLVFIPESNGATSEVFIREQLAWTPDLMAVMAMDKAVRAEGELRAVLQRGKWDAISGVVRAEFNARLKVQKRLPGRWRPQFNVLRRDFGKELALLAWAIEDADPALTNTALSNWLGLTPEERWWLYTMTAAATGHFRDGRNRGWRKAVRFALTENPAPGRVGESPKIPEQMRKALEG
jgi:hypothetical protein